jgi:hypothetical protein
MQHIDDPNQPTRRSQRERKISTRLLSRTCNPLLRLLFTISTAVTYPTVDDNKKRKRNDSDTEDDLQDITDIDDVQPVDGDDNDPQVDFDASKSKPTKGRRGKPPKGAPAAKKPRTTKVPVPKAPKTTTRKPRKPKADRDAFDPAKIAKDTKISADNPLFSALHPAFHLFRVIQIFIILDAILNPSAALQSTAEDFLESLVHTPGPAQAELINCFLRACGCNDSLDGDEVVDYDGVLDALDNFTESHKQVGIPPNLKFHAFKYPLDATGQLPSISPHFQTSRLQEIPKVSFRVHRTCHCFRCRTRLSLQH